MPEVFRSIPVDKDVIDAVKMIKRYIEDKALRNGMQLNCSYTDLVLYILLDIAEYDPLLFEMVKSKIPLWRIQKLQRIRELLAMSRLN